MLIHNLDERPYLGLVEELSELRVSHLTRLGCTEESERRNAEDRHRACLDKGFRHVEAQNLYSYGGARREVHGHGVHGHEQEEEQVMRLRSGQSLRSSVQPLDVPVAILRIEPRRKAGHVV